MLFYLFLLFEREKEYKKEIEHRAGWVERWRGSKKSWRVGETVIKICHLETLKQKLSQRIFLPLDSLTVYYSIFVSFSSDSSFLL